VTAYFGGTVVGARTRNAVVLAADRRLSYGTFVASHNVKKVHLIYERIGVAFAGLPGDMSGLLRILDSELRIYTATTGAEPTVYMAAKRLSIIMYAHKILPFLVDTLVGGLDPDGTSRLYALDSLGSITEEDFAAAGSGATIAYGYLEANYRDNLSVEELEKIVVEALKTALKRDAASGDGIDVLTITRGGAREKFLRASVTLEGK